MGHIQYPENQMGQNKGMPTCQYIVSDETHLEVFLSPLLLEDRAPLTHDE